MKIYLNDNWKFIYSFNEKFFKEDLKSESIRIPHTVKEIPYNYCDENDYETISGYKFKFRYSDTFKNKRVFLHFDGVAHQAWTYFNNELLGLHNCGYTGFKYEITNLLKKGINTIVVKVDNHESLNIPPFGHTIDYLCYGGIYRDVYLEVVNQSYIEDAYVSTYKENDKWYVRNDLNISGKFKEIKYEILDKDNKIIQNGESNKFNFTFKSKKIKIWDLENPNLYKIRYSLDKQKEKFEYTLAFREFSFKSDGFYLNDKKMKLRGLNRHQSYAYVGYAMPESMQRQDARILKNELGCNVVRTSHYPDDHSFYDECEKIGLLVITEIPGWQYIGDEEWKKIAIENTKEMVLQYRKHSSIILWGVRINESDDCDELYLETNKIAHKCDPYRQTTGIRCFTGSNLLEDVYSHNDFSFEGTKKKALVGKAKGIVNEEKMNAGYYISEYCGHMYPTKSFDDEPHRINHCFRHIEVLNAMYESNDIGGCTGWCMNDYNTHQDFGSGDRICYHGVLDMFRISKWASFVYASQGNEKPVLEVLSNMNIGEYPACNMGNIYVLSNADEVKLYKDNEFIKTYYPMEKYKSLPHAPFYIDDIIGDRLIKNEDYPKVIAKQITKCLLACAKYGVESLPFRYKLLYAKLMFINKISYKEAKNLYGKYVSGWGDKAKVFRFDAIKNNEVVKSVTKAASSKLKLNIEVSNKTLFEDKTYDVQEVFVKVVDENNNVVTYYQDSINASVSGDICLIGPNNLSFKGGQVGIYIKSNGKKGKGILKITSEKFDTQKIEFNININEKIDNIKGLE